jgi:hypothetical protein
MPLDLAGLKSDLEAFFAESRATREGCAAKWADAMSAYAAGIVPPSTTVSTARDALEAAVLAAISTPAAGPGMEAAFAAFALTVGGGMAGFVPTPPAAPVGFVTALLPPFPETHAAAATKWGDLIDDWMKTGSSALVAPPNTVIPWS